jgi:peptide/nickel transport system permease protein
MSTTLTQPAVERRKPARGFRRRHPLAMYIARRLALGLLTILLCAVLIFLVTAALPGDAARAILGNTATPETVAGLRATLGLDEPVPVQFWDWFSGFVTGDMGESLTQNEPVDTLIGRNVVNSAILIGLAALIVFPTSILLGAYIAYKRDSLFDHGSSVVLLALAAVPEFVIALTLILVFSTVVFEVLPASSVVQSGMPLDERIELMILPVATLVLWVLPYVSRLMRGSMLAVLESDYIEMARLKGLPEWRVLLRHGVPNGIAPIIQVTAFQLAALIGGVVIVEFVFNYPGIGQAFYGAVRARDLPVIQALALLIACAYVFLNLLADILTILVSPRLRTGPR